MLNIKNIQNLSIGLLVCLVLNFNLKAIDDRKDVPSGKDASAEAAIKPVGVWQPAGTWKSKRQLAAEIAAMAIEATAKSVIVTDSGSDSGSGAETELFNAIGASDTPKGSSPEASPLEPISARGSTADKTPETTAAAQARAISDEIESRARAARHAKAALYRTRTALPEEAILKIRRFFDEATKRDRNSNLKSVSASAHKYDKYKTV